MGGTVSCRRLLPWRQVAQAAVRAGFVMVLRPRLNLASGRVQPRHLVASAHMKVDQNPQPQTIKALAEMILLAANAQSAEQN